MVAVGEGKKGRKRERERESEEVCIVASSLIYYKVKERKGGKGGREIGGRGWRRRCFLVQLVVEKPFYAR